MTETEIKVATDHDLLVEVATDIKGISKKLDDVCAKHDLVEHRLTIIETEHRTIQASVGCNAQPTMSRRQQVGTAAVGGGIVGMVLAILEVVIKMTGHG